MGIHQDHRTRATSQKNYGGKASCWKARCSRSARYAAGLRRKRERRTLAWWRCFKRARVSRHLTISTAARSWALIGARRVSVAARTRTEPRTTRLGDATLRPVVRRSWWRWAPKNASRSLLVGGKPGTRRYWNRPGR